MIATFRSQSNARPFIQPKLSPFGLFHWHFQPLSSPQSFDPFVIHMPTCISQQRRDPTIAVSTKLPRQFDHVGYQPLFVGATSRDFALCGSMLSQNAASTAFRYVQFFADTINAGATTSGAQKFPFAASVKISLSSVRSDTALRSRSFSFCRRLSSFN